MIEGLKIAGWFTLFSFIVGIPAAFIWAWLEKKWNSESNTALREQFEKQWPIAGVILICIFIVFFFAKEYLGIPRPGAFFEKGSDYNARAYVLLFPEDSKSKNYRLVADISKTDGNYFLNAVYWPDGGTSTFDDCQLNIDKQSSSCRVSNTNQDIFYNAELTKDPVK